MLEPSPDRGGDAPSITPPFPHASQRGRRLQRPRIKGYKTPDGVIYAGRPTFLSNPFESRRNARGKRRFRHVRSVELHRRWLTRGIGALTLERLGFDPGEIDALFRLRARVRAALPRLRGRDLQCWCPRTSRWCHVDTLIELASAPSGQAH